MGAGRNKALLELAGRPILQYSVATFRTCCDRLLVVCASDDLEAVGQLLPDVPLVEGGATRHGSEQRALESLRPALAENDVVAMHDAARPIVSPDDVQSVFAAAQRHGAAMLALASELPLLELGAGRVVRAYPPAEVWHAQTPQAARAAWLLQAYDRAAQDAFEGTDTAAVLARAGFSVHVVPATSPNPKITRPADLVVAEGLLPLPWQ